jgi:hypothetical protein
MDLNSAIAELLGMLKSGISAGSQLLKEQFPILCQQIIRWGIWNNALTILLSVVLMFISWKIIMFSKARLPDSSDETGWWILIILSLFIAVVFFIFFWCSVFELGKIITAPNVYLIEYFKNLVAPNVSK